jgi:hypothetical protein
LPFAGLSVVLFFQARGRAGRQRRWAMAKFVELCVGKRVWRLGGYDWDAQSAREVAMEARTWAKAHKLAFHFRSNSRGWRLTLESTRAAYAVLMHVADLHRDFIVGLPEFHDAAAGLAFPLSFYSATGGEDRIDNTRDAAALAYLAGG